MSATLELPSGFAPVADDELDTLDGGTPVIAIVGAVIAAGGAAYGMGQVAGQRSYYAGLRNPEYQTIKWNVRGFVLGTLGAPLGGVFMIGFENQFYSMI